MNQTHLELCASAEWAETVQKYILPWVLDGVDLGDDVLEIGPGPGRTTDVIAGVVPRLTAVEIDHDLATALAARVPAHVEVIEADATDMPLLDGRFSAAISLTMLHHVPTPELQDRIFGEVARVLRPGGIFTGQDSRDSEEFRGLHIDDTCVPIDPDTLAGRLERAGFTDVLIAPNPYATRFRAVRAGTPDAT
ncbi:MAG: class I SAM-dependent methyltransferase [Chloroflexi bacterium]|nr:class I SAM-dependent methyltransferase [Chloroflexota bacterium]MDA1145867.1 class I SAM-dependent methyltransferase [Chloroflexota bacterium]